MAIVAVLLVVLASLTLVASAAGSPTGTVGPGTAQLTRPAISPIQQLTLVTGGTDSSRSVAHKGKKVGRIAGVCHLPI